MCHNVLILFLQISLSSNLDYHTVQPELEQVAQALVGREDKSIVSAILSNHQLWKLVVDQLLNEVGKECANLCRIKGFTSVLRQNGPTHLMHFSHTQCVCSWVNTTQGEKCAHECFSPPNGHNPFPWECQQTGVLLITVLIYSYIFTYKADLQLNTRGMYRLIYSWIFTYTYKGRCTVEITSCVCVCVCWGLGMLVLVHV